MSELTPAEKAKATRAKNKAAKEAAEAETCPVVKLDQEAKEEAIITSLGIYKNKGGWRFIKIQTQGDKVISREETDHDTLRTYCFDELKVQAVKTFMGDTY